MITSLNESPANPHFFSPRWFSGEIDMFTRFMLCIGFVPLVGAHINSYKNYRLYLNSEVSYQFHW